MPLTATTSGHFSASDLFVIDLNFVPKIRKRFLLTLSRRSICMPIFQDGFLPDSTPTDQSSKLFFLQNLGFSFFDFTNNIFIINKYK